MEGQSVWMSGPRQVELRREPLPPLAPGTVQVAARLSAISHGTEMLVYRGQVPEDLPLDLPTLSGSFAYPIKYGYASVGTVETVGDGVDGLHPGELVFSLHPHQDRYIVPADLTIPLPAGVSPEAGVFYANLETAVNILLDTPLHFGETVVVFGQGVVGLLVTLLLRQSAATQVIAVDPLDSRRDQAARLRADLTLAPDAKLAERVREATAGRGADVVIEVSGVPAALQQALPCVATQGTVVVASWYGMKPVPLNLGADFHRRRLRIVSSQVGLLDPALAPRWSYQRRRDLVRSLLAALPLSDLITQRIPFERAADAYELIERQPEAVTQVVLEY